jgi:membrane protein
MKEFFSDLRVALGPSALWQVVLKMRENDLLGLAGQLAYFFLLSFFPFLISLVALMGLVIESPELIIESLVETTAGFLPDRAIELVVDYIGRTLAEANTGVLLLGIAATLWLGSASSISIIKAANRAYGVRDGRSFFRFRGTTILMILTLIFLMMVLILVVFNVGLYLQRVGGLPEVFPTAWGLLRWVLVFITVTVALDIIYYLAPDAKLPFHWITPGGLTATVLIFIASFVLSFYASNLGSYAQIYGQLATVVVFMIWLYLTGLMVLLGIEINAVLARLTEERKNVELIRRNGSSKPQSS